MQSAGESLARAVGRGHRYRNSYSFPEGLASGKKATQSSAMDGSAEACVAARRLEVLSRHVNHSQTPGGPAVTANKTGVLGDVFAAATQPLVETERDGGWLVAKVLKAHGVRFVFTLSGGHISPVLVGAKATGIRVIDVRHEVNSVFAADAVARLTGVPGVAAVTAGPGCTNTLTAVKNAQMAQSPVVLIGGAAATLTQGRGALQDIDQMSLFVLILRIELPHVCFRGLASFYTQ